MKKSIIIAIVIILAILGVGVAIKFSQSGSTTENNGSKPLIQTEPDKNNPAAHIGEGEYKVTDDNFEKEIKQYKGVAMVDFYLTTCPHCQKIGPVISEIAKENQGKYKIGKLDANLNSKSSTEFAIESVPALIFFKDGKEIKRLIGEQPKQKILDVLAEVAK